MKHVYAADVEDLPVVGERYHQAAIWRALAEAGEAPDLTRRVVGATIPVEVRAAPDHPEDANAIAVVSAAGEPLGHLPRPMAARTVPPDPPVVTTAAVRGLADRSFADLRVYPRAERR